MAVITARSSSYEGNEGRTCLGLTSPKERELRCFENVNPVESAVGFGFVPKAV